VCIYLACKIEEFNISMSQFLQNININEDKEELANTILNYELMLIEKLDFNLTVHNFYRPFEGFILDVKVKFIIFPLFLFVDLFIILVNFFLRHVALKFKTQIF
jgi:cyclin H